MPISPKEVPGAPWSGSNGGGEFGEELKRCHEHQTSKMAAESAAGAAATNSGTSANTADSAPSPMPTPGSPVPKQAGGGSGDSDEVTGGAAAAESSDPASSEGGRGGDASVDSDDVAPAVVEADDTAAAGDDAKASPPPPFSEETPEEEFGELEPGKVRVRALYDYDATQDGDLSFHAGDMIITDGGAFSGDGWVSGDCRGGTGIFPANYTEPW